MDRSGSPLLDVEVLRMIRRSPLLKYGLALVSVAGFALAQRGFWAYLQPLSFVLLIPPVLLSSILGGFPAGVVATVAGAYVGQVFFMPGPEIGSMGHSIARLLAFVANGLLVSALTGYLVELYWRSAEAWLEERGARMGDAFMSLDSKLRYTYLNHRAWELVGLPKNEVIGKQYLEVFPQIAGSDLDRTIRAVVKSKEPVTLEFLSPVTNRWFDVSVYPDGGGVRLFTREITERKKSEEEAARRAEEALKMNKELQRLNRELARSNAELSQFAHIASHDMKEPLRMISNYVQLLSRRYGPKLDDEARTYIQFASDGAKRMYVLINDILEFSNLGRASGDPIPSRPLRACLSEAEDNLRVLIEENHAKIRCHDVPDVSAPSRQITQVFQNLISNAIKFRRPDAAPEIDVSFFDSGEAWIARVKDNGIGIDPADRSRIFQLFKRVHPHSEYPGSGIGLAMCKRIVNAMGGANLGRVGPRGRIGFLFLIAEGAGGRNAAGECMKMGYRVLLVEDNPADSRLISQGFQEGRPEIRITVATDGREATDRLFQRGEHSGAPAPDLVVLDLNLPKKDGREVLTEMKSSPRLRCIPVIILTSSEAPQDILSSYEAHANAYFSKPADLHEYFDTIDTIKEHWLGAVKLPPIPAT